MALLEKLGLVRKPEAPATPESENVTILSLARPALPGFEVGIATRLEHVTGDLVADGAAKPARLIAVLGPGASLMGLARVVRRLTPALQGAESVIDDERMARAIFVYDLLQAVAVVPAPLQTSDMMGPDWNAGRLLALPIEWNASDERWATHPEFLAAQAQAFPEEFRGGLDQAARELAVRDPWQTAEDAMDLLKKYPAVLAQGADAEQLAKALNGLADELIERLLINPYADVFCCVEVFRRLTNGPNAAGIMLVDQRLVDVLGLDRMELLAWSSGGAAVLRQLWRRLAKRRDEDGQSAFARVSAALRVRAADGRWPTPLEVELIDPNARPEPQEPPTLPTQRLAGKKKGLETRVRAMALGRLVAVGNEVPYKDPPLWVGPSYAGRLDPKVWLADHPNAKAAVVVKLGPDGTQAQGVPVPAEAVEERLEVVSRIALNEGWLDACRAADMGLISTGIHQWSAHNGAEFTVLVERFRAYAPDHYDLYFGLWGLQTKLWTHASDKFKVTVMKPVKGKKGELAPTPHYQLGERHDEPTDTEKAKVNPFGTEEPPDVVIVTDESRRAANRYFPSNATLFRVQPGKPVVRMPPYHPANLPPVNPVTTEPIEDVNARLVFFGGSTSEPHRFTAEWCARIRIAALTSMDYNVVQLQTAVWRFTRIDFDLDTFDPVDGDKDQQLARREFHREKKPPHKERPRQAAELFKSRYAAALLVDHHINALSFVSGAVSSAIRRTPTTLAGGDWLRRFQANYMATRRFPDEGATRERNQRINSLLDADNDQDERQSTRDRALSPDPMEPTWPGWASPPAGP